MSARKDGSAKLTMDHGSAWWAIITMLCFNLYLQGPVMFDRAATSRTTSMAWELRTMAARIVMCFVQTRRTSKTLGERCHSPLRGHCSPDHQLEITLGPIIVLHRIVHHEYSRPARQTQRSRASCIILFESFFGTRQSSAPRDRLVQPTIYARTDVNPSPASRKAMALMTRTEYYYSGFMYTVRI